VPRDYAIPARLATPGKHVVAVRVVNHFMEGGIMGKSWLGANGDSDRMFLHEGIWAERQEFAADTQRIGVRPSVPSDPLNPRASQQTPTTLYNAMVHPFTVLNVRGFVWYQGCSNTGNPKDYKVLQPLLIDCWRKAWGNPTAAFILAQLSAFQRHTPSERLPADFWKELEPDDTGYPQLRDVQDSMRSYPNTAVAVTIDIGDHSDIHPHNKKDVAYRLEQEAERLCYGNTGITAGPHVASMSVEDGRIRLSFTNVGGGLVAKGGKIGPHSFAIAGADAKHVWAYARVDGSTIVVSSPEVPRPTSVRYAWSMFPPNPNLYNAEGFPMYPFSIEDSGARVQGSGFRTCREIMDSGLRPES
jgi:sialate O-acetylesterase